MGISFEAPALHVNSPSMAPILYAFIATLFFSANALTAPTRHRDLVHGHAALAARLAAPAPAPSPLALDVQNPGATLAPRSKKKCPPKQKKPSPTSANPVNVESAAPSSDSSPSQPNPPPSSSNPEEAPAPAPSTPCAGPDAMVGSRSGDGTYYGTGLGACGITNHDTDFIVAVSEHFYDNFPGYFGTNPNNNPICNKRITATYQGKAVNVTITDRCVACACGSLDFSPAAFSQLADMAIGRIHGVVWWFLNE